jgi:lipoprotein-releasing system ATP-binding protein
MAEVLVENLTKRYKDADRDLCVIDNLTYRFAPSTSYAILGKSGIGKSTLLQLIGGLDQPTSGQVIINGVNVTTMSEDVRATFRGQNVGFVFQFHHLLPEFSALENVAMPLHVTGTSQKESLEKAEVILAKVGLKHRLTHRPSQLSGGEQQRVAIARSLVSEPKLLLADEPTGNLDVETSSEVREILLELHRLFSCTVIVVTHSEDFAEHLTHVLEMSPGGNLREVSSKDEIQSVTL